MEEVTEYIGDGVTVKFDGFSTVLSTPRLGRVDTIYLEPEHMDRLIAFYNRMKERANHGN